MALYFDLNADSIEADPALVRRVPYAVAAYYMALPLARENGRVSVAMAYPDNETARRTLGSLLQASVSPVFAPAKAIEAALQRVYRPPQPDRPALLAWAGDAAWETAVTETAVAISEMRHAPLTSLRGPQVSLSEALAVAANGRFALTVLHMPQNWQSLATTLTRAATPLLLVRGAYRPIRRILVAMRGFASDERALDWLTPFAQHFQASVTLMPITSGPGLGFSKYHQRESPAGRHLDSCLFRLHTEGVPVNLKFRQEDAVQQVAEEVAGDTYDLLAIAAEAEGDFVSQVLTAIDQQQVHNGRPIFVLKPPDLTPQLNS